jgi:hypothetical protein
MIVRTSSGGRSEKGDEGGGGEGGETAKKVVDIVRGGSGGITRAHQLQYSSDKLSSESAGVERKEKRTEMR